MMTPKTIDATKKVNWSPAIPNFEMIANLIFELPGSS
jgi:hypothetical protein